jgi:hypothetical protein
MDEETNSNSLNENQVKFKIFILVDIDLEDINLIYEKIIAHTEALSSKYIWNNQSFFLNKPVKCEALKDEKLDKFLFYSCSGLCDFGDNLEDEWYIVYILNSLTLKYPLKIAAQLNDQDGEFLLIQSANFLPKWASSAGDDCMRNRVFLFNGQVHIIPPASKPSEITYLPAAGPIKNDLNAVKCVFDFTKLTCAADSIQECIGKKLCAFDSDLSKTCFHKTTCIIPAKLAWLLNNNQGLISTAINRFCEKDPNDLKMCRFLNHFKPNDMVSYRIQFTKHLYGKLKYCDYKPDKRHNWPSTSELMSQQSTTIKPKQTAVGESTASNAAALLRERSALGFKLTCAFEIFINNILTKKTNSKTFEDYLSRLKNLGYFKNFMEHSQKYNELMEKAKESFLQEQIKSNLIK